MKEVQINKSSKFAVMTTHPAFQTIIFVLTRYFAIIKKKQREENVTERERQEEREKERERERRNRIRQKNREENLRERTRQKFLWFQLNATLDHSLLKEFDVLSFTSGYAPGGL